MLLLPLQPSLTQNVLWSSASFSFFGRDRKQLLLRSAVVIASVLQPHFAAASIIITAAELCLTLSPFSLSFSFTCRSKMPLYKSTRMATLAPIWIWNHRWPSRRRRLRDCKPGECTTNHIPCKAATLIFTFLTLNSFSILCCCRESAENVHMELGFWGSCSWVACSLLAFHHRQTDSTHTHTDTLCAWQMWETSQGERERLLHLLIKILPGCCQACGAIKNVAICGTGNCATNCHKGRGEEGEQTECLTACQAVGTHWPATFAYSHLHIASSLAVRATCCCSFFFWAATCS